MRVIVLGAGLVGGPMAIDLARDERFDVSVADIDTGALGTLARQAAIRPVTRDLSHPEEVTDLVRDFDLVVDAVPGARNSQHRLGPEVIGVPVAAAEGYLQ